MIGRRKARTLAALIAAISLALAACGTRLEHADIVAANSGAAGGAGTGLPGSGPATGLPGSDPGAGPGGSGPGDTAAGPGGTSRSPGRTASGPGGQGSGPGDTGGSATGAPIVVGAVGTYSGPAGSTTKNGARALQAWAAATNARGGIHGRPIKTIIYDDGNDRGKAQSLLRRLVEQDKAVALLDANTAAVSGFKSYVEKKQFPVLGSCATVAFESPMFFSPCQTFPDAVYLGALTGAKFGKGDKWAALFCVEAPDCQNAADLFFNKGLAKKAGLDPVYRADVSATQPDYTAQCIEARNRGARLISVFLDTNSVERVAESCRRQGYNPQFLLDNGSSAIDFPTKPAFADMLAYSRVFPYTGLSTPAAKEFAAAWNKHAGGASPSGFAAQAWAAAKVFEAAAKKAGKDVSRESLIKALRGFSGETFGGLTVPLTFTAKGSQPASCQFHMRASSGKWIANPKPLCS